MPTYTDNKTTKNDKITNKLVEPGPGDVVECEQCGLQRLVQEVTNLRRVTYGTEIG